MSDQPDHELEVLEEDQTVPPRPEEAIADVNRLRGDERAPASNGETPLQRGNAPVTGDPQQLA